MRYYTTKLFILGAFLFLGMAADISAAGGNLDTGFNGSGKSVFNIESSLAPGSFTDVVVIGGNKFLVAGRVLTGSGSYYAATVSRFNSDGSPDVSFGAGGKVITDTGASSEATALAVQSDGKIVVTGIAGTYPDRRIFVLRYTPDGVLDTGFGNNGVFFVGMKVARDIAVLADDKILVAGASDIPNLGITQVAKFNANGFPDTTFGNGGIATSTYSNGSETDKMAIQSDGKIVVSGRVNFTVTRGLVHRFNADGSRDGTFGTDGYREIIGPGFTRMYMGGGVAIQPDGKIVLAGVAQTASQNDTQIMLMKLNPDGSSDESFGPSGIVFHELSADYDSASDMKLQSDGKILVSGQRANAAIVARFDSAGALDSGFGTGGVALLSPGFNASAIALQSQNVVAIGSGSGSSIFLARLDPAGANLLYRNETFVIGKNDQARDVAVQPDGKIVTAGVSENANTSIVSVARLLPNGNLDTEFGNGGRVTISDGTSSSEGFAVDIQPDGKIVVAGRGSQFFSFSYYSLFVARLNADGSLDNTFGTGGKVIITSPSNLLGYDMELQPDGKIVVGGTIYRVVGDGAFDYDMMAVRLNRDGTPDSGFGSNGIFIYFHGTASATFFEQAKALSIQPDGKIILAGTHLLRLASNGIIDASFSPTPVPLTFPATDVKLQPDGKILLGGAQNSDFALARYKPDASIDTGFGINGTGIAVLDFGGNDIANAIYLETNGDILAGGSTQGGSPSRKKFALARFKPNGSPDASFGAVGKVITDFGGDAEIFGLARQNDGKIVAAGGAKVNIDRDYAAARYLSRTVRFDFDGDGRADVSVFRPSDGVWYLNRSSEGFSAHQFGISTDKLAAADYDGDGKADEAVFRAGVWYLLRSQAGFAAYQFGATGDIPQPADFDGDGKAELAVFRPSNGTWYVLNLATNQFNGVQFGASGDKPVVADFDGDGKADYAVYRPSDGVWYLLRSQSGFAGIQFGISTDKPVVGDYDGDGKADPAVYRDGVWYLLRSSQGFAAVRFGIAADLPAPADYDGDGKTDLAVYRDDTWYLLQSTNGFSGLRFGSPGDKPVPNSPVQ
ncbi:MAG TPA: FG-GAP-like repeat-containing protein [Pyrinomonadaceae bacterium]|jgi:uncharacterized delta-60 repeat protein